MPQKFTKQIGIENDFLVRWNQIQKSNPNFQHPYAIKHKTQYIFSYIFWEIKHKTQSTMNKTLYFQKLIYTASTAKWDQQHGSAFFGSPSVAAWVGGMGCQVWWRVSSNVKRVLRLTWECYFFFFFFRMTMSEFFFFFLC